MKYFNYFIVLALLLAPLMSNTQVVYQKTYRDGEITLFTDVCTASNDELVTSGFWTSTPSITPSQASLSRLDIEGNVVWAKAYETPGVARGTSVAACADGGFLSVGWVDTLLGVGGSRDAFVMKVNQDGNLLWKTIIGGNDEDEFSRVYEAPNGDVIAIGKTENNTTSIEKFWFVRLSPTGSLIQSFVYFPTLNAEAHALAFHPDGGYLIAGIGRLNFIDEAYLFKISDMGVLEAYRTYGTFAGSERINDVIILEDTSVVFVGTRYQSDYDIFMAKTNKLGVLQWFKDFGGPDHDEAYRLLEDPNGGFIVSGSTEGLDGAKGPMIFKTNASGDIVWAKVMGDAVNSGTVGLTSLSNGGYAIAGTNLPNQGTAVGVIAQVKSDGNGCIHSLVALPAVTVTTNLDLPVVSASIGPSATVAYTPVEVDMTLIDSTECTTLVAIENRIAEHQIALYPNPVGETLWISFKDIILEDASIEIFDFLGQSIFKKDILHENISISTEDWSFGIYLVSIRVGEYQQVKRMVLRK